MHFTIHRLLPLILVFQLAFESIFPSFSSALGAQDGVSAKAAAEEADALLHNPQVASNLDIFFPWSKVDYEQTPPPPGEDVLHLEQVRLKLKLNTSFVRGGKYVPVGDATPLATENGINPNLTPVSIANPVTDIELLYDKASKQLLVIKNKPNKDGTYDAIVFENLELVGEPLVSAYFLQFATKDAVYVVPWEQVQASRFQAPLIDLPVAVTPGVQVLAMRESQIMGPRENLSELAGDDLLAGSSRGLDQVWTLKVPGLTTPVPTKVSLRRIAKSYEEYLAMVLALMQVANPDMMRADVVQRIIDDNAADQVNFEAQRTQVLDRYLSSPKFDVKQRAVRANVQVVGMKHYIDLLRKDPSGKTAFDKVLTAGRDVFPDDPSENGPLAQLQNNVNEAKRYAEQAGLDKPEREILIDVLKQSDPQILKAGYEHERYIRARFYRRPWETFKTWATPERLRRTAFWCLKAAGVGGAIVGAHVGIGLGLNALLGGDHALWSLSLIMKMIETSTHIPLIGAFTKQMYAASGFFKNWGNVMAALAGLGAVLSLGGAGYLVGGVVARIKGLSRGIVDGFFQVGKWWYFAVSWPIQMLFHKMYGTGDHYRWLEFNVNPLEHKEGRAELVPFKKGQLGTLTQVINKDADRKLRAMLTAAVIVSEGSRYTDTPIDEATLVDLTKKLSAGAHDLATSLLSASSQEKARAYLDWVGTASQDAQWTQTVNELYAGLTAIGDQGVEPADSAYMSQYTALFTRTFANYRAAIKQSPDGAQTENFIKKRIIFARRLMASPTLSYVVYGDKQYREALKMEGATMDHTSVSMAAVQYNVDYPASAVIYAAVAPASFAAIPRFQPGMWRIVWDQSAQVLIYQGQGGQDAAKSAVQEGLPRPPTPAVIEAMKPYRRRRQTVGEALSAIKHRYLQTNTKGAFENHLQYMNNFFMAVKPRGFIDFFTRIVGLALTAGSITAASFLPLSGRTLAFTGVFLLGKLSLGWLGNSALVGYATPWPPLGIAMRNMREAAQENRAYLETADSLVLNALEAQKYRPLTPDDLDNLRSGIQMLQDAYKKDGLPLPAEFNIDPSDYTLDLAADFHAYTKKFVPLPTEHSHILDLSINLMLGTVLSAILFNPFSQSLGYSGDKTNPLVLLGQVAVDFAGTFAFLKLVGIPAENRLRRYLKDRENNSDRGLNASSEARPSILKGCSAALGSLKQLSPFTPRASRPKASFSDYIKF